MKASNHLKFIVTLVVVALLAGCAGKPTKGRPGIPSGQAETPAQKKSVALVFGGAGIASFAAVGILKQFQNEGIEISYIVSTGWPSIFALGAGMFKSVHDLEWFAMRLKEKDFYSSGLFDFKKGFSDHDRIASRLQKSFRSGSLSDSKIPVHLTATNLEKAEPDVYSSGSWMSPLLKSISIPGVFRPYPNDSKQQWVVSLNGIDVVEAKKRGADIVIAVNMYDDYFDYVGNTERDSSESVFRRLFLTQLKDRVRAQLAEATYVSTIYLRKSPTDFAARRQAISLGANEGARLIRQIRSRLME